MEDGVYQCVEDDDIKDEEIYADLRNTEVFVDVNTEDVQSESASCTDEVGQRVGDEKVESDLLKDKDDEKSSKEDRAIQKEAMEKRLKEDHICLFFIKNRCWYGRKCRNSHVIPSYCSDLKMRGNVPIDKSKQQSKGSDEEKAENKSEKNRRERTRDTNEERRRNGDERASREYGRKDRENETRQYRRTYRDEEESSYDQSRRNYNGRRQQGDYRTTQNDTIKRMEENLNLIKTQMNFLEKSLVKITRR